MTANEAILKMRVLLGVEEVLAPVAMNSATLVDGTLVEVEGEIEVGKTLFVTTPEGQLPAPAGMHATTDNMMITVDESGTIVSIEEITPEVETPEVEIEVEMAEEEIVEAPEEEKEIEVMLAEEMIVKIVEAMKPYFEEIKDLKETVTEMKSKFQKFSKEPAAKPIKKAEAFTANKMDAIGRIKSVRNNK